MIHFRWLIRISREFDFNFRTKYIYDSAYTYWAMETAQIVVSTVLKYALLVCWSIRERKINCGKEKIESDWEEPRHHNAIQCHPNPNGTLYCTEEQSFCFARDLRLTLPKANQF